MYGADLSGIKYQKLKNNLPLPINDPQSFEYFDLRTMGLITGVKDQNLFSNCKCSWAFAVVGFLEGLYIKRHNVPA